MRLNILGHSRGGPLTTRLTGALVVTTLSALLITYVIVWVPCLPGPHQGAYSAYASLVNIRSGLRAYCQLHGCLPQGVTAKGDLPYSWRIEVYRQWSAWDASGANPVVYDTSKAWNDRSNLRLQGLGAFLFRYAQNDPGPEREMGRRGCYATYYKAITGPGTAFDGASPTSPSNLPRNLILIVRVERSETHWMEPEDLSIEQLAPSEEAKRLLMGQDGYAVLFAGGEIWVLSVRTPISDLCKFFTRAGAAQFDRDKVLGPYRVVP
jgi:hypothetical protein